MKIFRENLYLATMTSPRQGRLIAYRANHGKLNIGDNIFDLLCIPASEEAYLLKRLFSGGEVPIIITSEECAVIVDRRMLYSTGVCCFVVPDLERDIVCSVLYREGFGGCDMSPSAIDAATGASIQDEQALAQAYVTLSKYTGFFSCLSDRASPRDFISVASRICDEIGCELVIGKSVYNTRLDERKGMVYGNSLYAFAVLIAAFVSKIISDERAVYVDAEDGEHIRISVGCENLPRDIRDTADYICAVARDRDAEATVSIADGMLSLNICPFYADIGLMGVKATPELKEI